MPENPFHQKMEAIARAVAKDEFEVSDRDIQGKVEKALADARKKLVEEVLKDVQAKLAPLAQKILQPMIEELEVKLESATSDNVAAELHRMLDIGPARKSPKHARADKAAKARAQAEAEVAEVEHEAREKPPKKPFCTGCKRNLRKKRGVAGVVYCANESCAEAGKELPA